MSKDPAFLFYHHDFIFGTAFMSLEERGAYITILCFMADKGPLKLEEIIRICRDFDPLPLLISKFKTDGNDIYYHKRLMEEVEKRKSFCESRRLSRTSNVRKTYVKRMENENVNENKDINKKDDGVKGKKDFVIPTIQELKNYCKERRNYVDPNKWLSFYESKGWMIGKNKMKDWKAAVRSWEDGKFKPLENNEALVNMNKWKAEQEQENK